jgi:hypothetical protein
MLVQIRLIENFHRSTQRQGNQLWAGLLPICPQALDGAEKSVETEIFRNIAQNSLNHWPNNQAGHSLDSCCLFLKIQRA